MKDADQTTFDFTPRARVDDPETSHEAATLARCRANPVAMSVLMTLRVHGVQTDEAIGQIMNAENSSHRGRRADLVRAGLVMEWDRLGQTRSGAACIRWALTQKGEDLAREIEQGN